MVEKKKNGRPKIEIDYETAEKLATIFCTQEEIAGFLNVSVSTLQHDQKFLQVHKKGIQTAKASLRRTQWKLAQKSATMAIFMGKNYLGQRDTQEIDLGENAADYFKEVARAIRESDGNPE